MSYLIILNNSILPIIFIILIAFVYNKIISSSSNDIVKLAIYLFTPIMIFTNLVDYNVDIQALVKPFIFMSFYTITLVVMSYIIGKLLKLNNDNLISFILSISMINIGNYGIPLIYFSLGKEGEIYSIIYYIVFNISLSTIGIYLCSPKKNIGSIMKNILKIPIFSAAILAIIFTSFNLVMPTSLKNSLFLLSEGAIPLLIFIMGLQISNIKFNISYIIPIMVATILRLFISPFIALLFLFLLNIDGLERSAALIQTSTPSAMVPLMMNILFGRSTDLLASIIFSTTLLSVISLPLVIKLFA